MNSILIAGATGFTGRYVVQEFAQCGQYRIAAFVRDPARLCAQSRAAIQTVHTGTFDRIDTLRHALEGYDTFICCASLGFGHGPSIVRACERAGVRRAIFISTTAIFTRLNPSTKTIRIQAEESIRNSSLRYTILRPTMIYGAPGDRNMERLIAYVNRFPILPVPGPGTFLIQPVYVGDVARAVRLAAQSANAVNASYTVSGRDALAYNDLVRLIGRLLGKRIGLLHIPLGIMTVAFSIYERLSPRPRLKAEQLHRLNEDKQFGYDDAARDFGYEPRGLEQTLSDQIASLRASR
jgi:uncharacterized protein YbjT (DUF2867 family)